MKLQEICVPKIAVQMRSDEERWSTTYERSVSCFSIAAGREFLVSELEYIKSQLEVESLDRAAKEDLAEHRDWLVSQIEEYNELERSGVSPFAILRYPEREIEAPLLRPPCIFPDAPEFPCFEYDATAGTLGFRGCPMPARFLRREIIEYGDGLFKMGDVDHKVHIYDGGVSFLISPESKEQVFLDLLRFMQCLWDNSQFSRLPVLDSAEAFATSRALHAFIGVTDGRLVMGFRSSPREEFVGCDLEADMEEESLGDYAYQCLQDILCSLQWGFRHCMHEVVRSNVKLELVGLEWVPFKLTGFEAVSVMTGYLEASKGGYLSFCTGLTDKNPSWAYYKSKIALQKAFSERR